MTQVRSGAGLGRRLVRNTLLAASGRIVALAGWFLLTPFLLRSLGPEGFAVWALFFALTGYLAAVDLGMIQGTIRNVATARQQGDADGPGAITALGLASFGLLGLLWAALAFLTREPLLALLHVPPSQAEAARVAILAAPAIFTLAGIANVLMAALQACDRFDLANLASLLATCAQFAGVAIGLRSAAGLPGLIGALGAGWAIGALAAVVSLRLGVREFRWVGWGASRPYLRRVIAFGGPMQIAAVLSVLHTQLDKLLLPAWVSLAALTPYELGSRVPAALQNLPLLLLLAMLPAASSLHASGEIGRLEELYARGSRYVLSVVAVLLAALLGSGGRLYDVWLGPGHGDAVLAMRGLAIATALALATGMGTVTARAIGRTDLEAWFAALVLAIHLGLSALWIPRWGLNGAVLALLVANAIACPTFLVWLARAMGWRTSAVLTRPHARPALAAALGSLAAYGADRALAHPAGALGWGVLLAVTSAGVIVATAWLLVTRFLRWEELVALLTPGRPFAARAAADRPAP